MKVIIYMSDLTLLVKEWKGKFKIKKKKKEKEKGFSCLLEMGVSEI